MTNISAFGETEKEALKELSDAFSLWVETLNDLMVAKKTTYVDRMRKRENNI